MLNYSLKNKRHILFQCFQHAGVPTKLIANHKTRNKSVKKREKGVCTECGKILKHISN